ncbi:GTP-binding protein SAR1A [Vitis vinifera]|uniref:GTP-binding protein SAR1A n=1 Tax=Vitis vinifera TaxID=29760 RepID=A0A438DWL2_VITVI|nr:GTP-binding protein SAR1A [Vitis vinifera]
MTKSNRQFRFSPRLYRPTSPAIEALTGQTGNHTTVRDIRSGRPVKTQGGENFLVYFPSFSRLPLYFFRYFPSNQTVGISAPVGFSGEFVDKFVVFGLIPVNWPRFESRILSEHHVSFRLVLWTSRIFGAMAKRGEDLILGLDNAGKTTLLHMLKDEVRCFWIFHAAEISSASTNAASDVRGIEYWGKLSLKPLIWVGIRSLEESGRIIMPSTYLVDANPYRFFPFSYRDMGRMVDAVVYLVDAYDKERFAESKRELDALLSDESLANVPFLILGNKIDIPYAASEDELRYHLGLTNFTTGKGKVNLVDSNVRPLEVFMCSIVRKMGYGEGFKWVSQYIK